MDLSCLMEGLPISSHTTFPILGTFEESPSGKGGMVRDSKSGKKLTDCKSNESLYIGLNPTSSNGRFEFVYLSNMGRTQCVVSFEV